jgi:hypothetical protein
MSLPTHSTLVMSGLKDNEGPLRLLTEQENVPSNIEAFSTLLSVANLVHGQMDCPVLRYVVISASKSVLCCDRCLLRLSFPTQLKTVGDLRSYLCS